MKNKKLWAAIIAGFLAFVMIFSLIISLLPTGARAASVSEETGVEILRLQNENEKIQQQIADLKNQKTENLSQVDTVVARKSLLQQEVSLLREQSENINQEIDARNVLIGSRQQTLYETQAYLEKLSIEHKLRIRELEENGRFSKWKLLFEAESFLDFLHRLGRISQGACDDEARLKKIDEIAEEVAQQQTALQQERAKMYEAEARRDQILATLDTRSQESLELLNELTDDGEQFKEMTVRYESSTTVKGGQLLANSGNTATVATAPEYKPVADEKKNPNVGVGGTTVVDDNGISWVVPCTYDKISSPFGWRIHPIYGDRRHHNGVDVNAQCLKHSDGTTDSPIYASRSGVVLKATWHDLSGWHVIIDHLDGYVTTYMHMCEKPPVHAGDAVAAGQVIGCIGHTGSATSDHLHFGISYNGKPVDPMDYIG